MFKIKTILFGVTMAVSVAGLSGATSPAAGLKPGADITALGSLISLSPSPTVPPAPAVQKAEVAPSAPETAKAIEPGRDLSPKVEDPVRVNAILKLVSDIYNNVHLPYAQDGSTFTNREKILPIKPSGFYKEYTLLTGDAPHTVVIGGHTYHVAPDQGARGSERVVIGGGAELYYTPDHYARFIRLTVVR